jgi:peptidoglycan/LPS O-acetylase OafA/YrhL
MFTGKRGNAPTPAPMHPQKSVTHHSQIPALDGLRGIAIIMVLLWHLPTSLTFFPGWIGVDLFFVLSGYLITWRLVATKDQPDYYSRFYRNRILRIFPLYYLLVVGFLLAIHLFVQQKNLSIFDTYTNHWKSFLIFTENWTFMFYPLPRDLSLGPLWSIAVEEQFYLIWPAIIFFLSGTRTSLKVFGCLIAIVMLARTIGYLIHPSYPRLYYNSFFRMDSFVIGALLYQLHKARIKISQNLVSWIMLGALILLLFNSLSFKKPLPDDPFMMTVGYTILALFFACLLHLATRPEKNMLVGFLNGKLLRGIGKISFCLYLIHFPVLQIVSSRFHAYNLNHWPGHETLLGILSVTTALTLSILISIVSFRYYESFFLALKK